MTAGFMMRGGFSGVLPAGEAFEPAAEEPGSEFVVTTLEHHLAAVFLEFLNGSFEGKFAVLVAVAAIIGV